MATPVVRAIDVGYGNTKFTTGRSTAHGLQCALFRSLAAQASRHSLAGSVLARRDTVIVEVRGTKFEVGPDVELAMGLQHARPLHDDYVASDDYLALNLGALSYIGEPAIDHLVVGLPVNLWATRRDQVRELLTGIHTVAESREVLVRHVNVVAQPIGGFIEYSAMTGQTDHVADKHFLIVDPGYFTLDWLATRGFRPNDSCSSSVDNSGMHAILRAIAAGISAELGRRYDDLEAIDRGLQDGQVFINGKPWSLARFFPEAERVVDLGINAMVSAVGGLQSFHEILLVGGGACFYAPALKRHFPDRPIRELGNPVFANVRGFHRAGERTARLGSERAA